MSRTDGGDQAALLGDLFERGIRKIWENSLRRGGIESRSPEAVAVLTDIVAAVFDQLFGGRGNAEDWQQARAIFAERGLELTGGENGGPLELAWLPRH
jgi:hypothetical protein